MSTILEPLVQRLREIPSTRWEDVAKAAGCAKSLPRKLATRDRTNPGVQTLEPLIRYFAAVDAGKKRLPPGCDGVRKGSHSPKCAAPAEALPSPSVAGV